MHAATQGHLISSLQSEALAAARYFAYAARASYEGDAQSAEALRSIGMRDLHHARELLRALGWSGDLRDDLAAALIDDTTVPALAHASGATYARDAGDDALVDLFARLLADEALNARALRELVATARRPQANHGSRPPAAFNSSLAQPRRIRAGGRAGPSGSSARSSRASP